MRIRVFCGILSMSAVLLAQSERGNITGLVTDATGAVVPNVSVVITNTATNVPEHVTTTSAGEYNAPNLVPGNYRIEIAAAGFKRFTEGGIALTAGSTARVDARLELGTVGESIEVTASALQLQTENSRISTAVQNVMVDQLPLVVGGAMRSPYDLVAVAAESKGSGTSLSLGGGQAASWSATLDGLLVNTNRSSDAGETSYLAPSVESITEFAVDTNGFKAEFGQAGGGVITFVSKSGTNEYHGVAYDFLRNDAFDARGFFAPSRSIYKQNDFGVTAGGPVWIPKVYKGRNRTFFFAAYEGFRNRLGQNGSILSVPTPEMYQGDFSKLVSSSGSLIPIYDPSTTQPNPSGSGSIRQPFTNNQIPQSRFSTIAKQMLSLAPQVAPNRSGLVPGSPNWVRNNYVVNNGSLTYPTNKGSIKIDQNFGNNHHLAFFYNRSSYVNEPGPSGAPGLPLPLWNGQFTSYDAADYRMTYDWTITPRLLNHFSVGGNKFYKDAYSPNVGKNWKSKVCIPNVVDCNTNYPNVTFSEFTGWGATADNGTEQPMWAIREDLSFIRGAHTMKFGYDFQSPHAAGFGQQNISGNAGFSFLETAAPGATSATSGSSFASFLLGLADTGATETIRYLPQIYDYHAVYVQDDWRVNKRLTLNLGLRYELTRPPYQPQQQYEDFSPTTPNPAVNNYPGALIFVGYGPGRVGSKYLSPGFYGGWGPRLGLAYGLNSKTTIRAGAARTFARSTVVSGTTHYDGFIGQYSFASTNQGITPAFSLDTGLPSYPLPPQIIPTFDNNNNTNYWNGHDATRMPEILAYTFSVQRQLSASTILEADYNATVGAHLQTGLLNINQVPMSTVNALINQLGAAATVSLLNSSITSSAAQTAGIPLPYPNFTNSSVQRAMSVGQALRPFPQYLTIDTSQSGDKSGHSSYNALVLKLDHRFSHGLTMQWSYGFSKLLTDSDTYYANAGFAEDQGNRRLEKSIGAYDQTHVVKLNTLYELPFGKGRRWLTHGFAAQALGGWRISAIQVYNSGFPIAVTRNAPMNIFNGVNRPIITTYDWKASWTGGFDPNKNVYLSASAFPAQTPGLLGNATRFDPLVRQFANRNENVSLGKTFPMSERFRLDFRAEAFNLFNRTVFGSPSTNLNSNSFGLITSQSNSPRQIQLALKLYW
jgi:hypothetical protein